MASLGAWGSLGGGGCLEVPDYYRREGLLEVALAEVVTLDGYCGSGRGEAGGDGGVHITRRERQMLALKIPPERGCDRHPQPHPSSSRPPWLC